MSGLWITHLRPSVKVADELCGGHAGARTGLGRAVAGTSRPAGATAAEKKNPATGVAGFRMSESRTWRLLRDHLGHVGRLLSFRAVHDFEFDFLPLAQRPEARALDGGIMDEYVITV